MRLILFICSSHSNKERKELNALKVIVLLRTEGLLLLEITKAQTLQNEVNVSCVRIRNFYTESQINLLELCINKPIDLSMDYSNAIQNRLELTDSINLGDKIIENLIVNFKKQKSAYLAILLDRELTSMHYFALHSYQNVQYFIDKLSGLIYHKHFSYI